MVKHEDPDLPAGTDAQTAIYLERQLSRLVGGTETIPFTRVLEYEPRQLEKFRELTGLVIPGTKLTLAHFAHIEILKGILAVQKERYRDAIGFFRFAQTLAEQAGDNVAAAWAGFHLARSHYKIGNYDAAVRGALESKLKLGEIAGNTSGATTPAAKAVAKGVALIGLIEAWARFALNEVDAAQELFQRSQDVLQSSEDNVLVAEMSAFGARISRRYGRYEQALDDWAKTIETLENAKLPQDGYLIRALTQRAFCNLLLARTASPQDQGRHRDDAIRDLFQADKRLHRQSTQRIQMQLRLHYFRSFYHYDVGDWATSFSEAQCAGRLAAAIEDRSILAHAHVMMSKSSRGSADAVEHARSAMDCARLTDNRRVKVRANTCLAMAELRKQSPDMELVNRSYVDAVQQLRDSDRDYLRDEVEGLGRELNPEDSDRVIEIHVRRAFQDGLQKTIDNLVGDLVREAQKRGDSVSEVANRLSTSRTRVRKFLGAHKEGASE